MGEKKSPVLKINQHLTHGGNKPTLFRTVVYLPRLTIGTHPQQDGDILHSFSLRRKLEEYITICGNKPMIYRNLTFVERKYHEIR